MAGASDYLELELLDHVFGKGAYTPPSIYIALCTAAPLDSDDGSTITEASYTGYARISTTAGDWNTAAVGQLSNANELQFAACTGGSSVITYVALVDAASNGNLLIYGELDASLSVSNGITPKFNAGSLVITLS